MQKFRDIAIAIKRLDRKIKALCLFFIILFLLLLSMALAPMHKMQEFERLVNSDSLFLEKYDPVYNQPEMRQMVKEKAFKEALVKLAESDSIQMVMNLSDSTINLSIKGVVIHQTKVASFYRDKLLNRMPLMQQVKLFSQPVAVQSQYATIVKEPVVIRQAPKDTLEAALNAWQPDTLIQNPAYLILSLDHGIYIIFEQETNPTFHDKWTRFAFYNRLRIRGSIRAVFRFVTFKKQDYHPAITIKMPADDLRAIYRALPGQPFIVIHL
ncbi:MAG: hypothetical protein V2B15_05870 [Bacteroidota bacterium]